MTDSIENRRRLTDLGLLALRAMVGLSFMAHGAQKLFGWFGGYGLEGTAGFFESLGFTPGTLFAVMSGASEVLGGLLITLGFLGVVGPALIVSVMVVAIVTVHLPNGFFAASNGVEMPLLFAVSALALALVGFGRYALDVRIPRAAVLQRPAVVLGAVALSVVGAMGSLMVR